MTAAAAPAADATAVLLASPVAARPMAAQLLFKGAGLRPELRGWPLWPAQCGCSRPLGHSLRTMHGLLQLVPVQNKTRDIQKWLAAGAP